jgi:hypothetical protein
MNNKGLELILMTLFGGAGLVLLVAGFTLPYLAADRVMAAIGGALGVGFTVVQAFRLVHGRRAAVPVTVETPSVENR